MIDFWLRSGIAGIVILPFLVFYPVAALIVWLTHLSPARPFFASCVSASMSARLPGGRSMTGRSEMRSPARKGELAPDDPAGTA